MSDTTIGFDQTENEILTYEVSDEALESAVFTKTGKAESLTISFCTGLDSCPS
jgi:hypothetical protein